MAIFKIPLLILMFFSGNHLHLSFCPYLLFQWMFISPLYCWSLTFSLHRDLASSVIPSFSCIFLPYVDFSPLSFKHAEISLQSKNKNQTSSSYLSRWSSLWCCLPSPSPLTYTHPFHCTATVLTIFSPVFEHYFHLNPEDASQARDTVQFRNHIN